MRWLTHIAFATGQLAITQDGRTEVYSVSPLNNDFGSLAVRMEKSSDPDATYDILVDEQSVSCSCPGGTYRGACKHASAVLALAARSEL